MGFSLTRAATLPGMIECAEGAATPSDAAAPAADVNAITQPGGAETHSSAAAATAATGTAANSPAGGGGRRQREWGEATASEWGRGEGAEAASAVAHGVDVHGCGGSTTSTLPVSAVRFDID